MKMPRIIEVPINRLFVIGNTKNDTSNMPDLRSPTEYQTHTNKMPKLRAPREKIQSS
jgi:hypothetical protein